MSRTLLSEENYKEQERISSAATAKAHYIGKPKSHLSPTHPPTSIQNKRTNYDLQFYMHQISFNWGKYSTIPFTPSMAQSEWQWLAKELEQKI